MFAEEEKENYSTHGNHRAWGRIIEYSSGSGFADLILQTSSKILTRYTVHGNMKSELF